MSSVSIKSVQVYRFVNLVYGTNMTTAKETMTPSNSNPRPTVRALVNTTRYEIRVKKQSTSEMLTGPTMKQLY